MSYFETPNLHGIALYREYQNTLTDRISSKPAKNQKLIAVASFLEGNLLGIDHQMPVKEYKYRSHMHIAPYGDNDRGYFKFYQGGNGKNVMVLPPRGSYYGYNFARMVSSYLASEGFDVYVVITPFHGERLPAGITSVVNMPIDTDILKLTAKQSVEEVLGLIQHIGEDVGLVGLSQGAIYGSIVSCLDKHVKSVVLVHGFGDIAGFLKYSNERFALQFRKTAGDIDEINLRQELRNIDPLTYATSDKAANKLMINGKRDNSIPMQNIMALWNAFGNPELQMYWEDIAGDCYKPFIGLRLRVIQEISYPSGVA